jgi:hypothetical protein
MTSVSRSEYEDSTKHLIAYGTTGFAGVMLATVAVFQILEGISAIAKDDIYLSGVNYVYEFDISTWGWIHLILGIVAFATGLGIIFRQMWGQLAGIAIACLGCLASFSFLPYEPVWSLIIVAFNVLVIWGLCVQLGSDRDPF